ncbi:MAG: lipocalin family protein [Flavobacteriaceae bacterium]|nr:lipocalin family protein [Flavobacteriaceae bacterium]
MKNLLFLFGFMAFVAFGFVSCSGDDDGGNDVVNSNFTGKWTTDFNVFAGQIVNITSCDEKVEYNFNTNGTFTMKTFTGEDLTNCADDTQVSGKWQYLGNEKYLIHTNSVTISDANRDQYTYHLNFPRNSRMDMWSLASHNGNLNTYTVFIK